MRGAYKSSDCRSREFLWQEGHTAFATKEEADAEVWHQTVILGIFLFGHIVQPASVVIFCPCILIEELLSPALIFFYISSLLNKIYKPCHYVPFLGVLIVDKLVMHFLFASVAHYMHIILYSPPPKHVNFLSFRYFSQTILN